MKKIILGLTALIITCSAMAQHENRGKGRNHEKQEMLSDLNLNADQKSQMKSLNEGFKKQMQEVKDNTSLSDAEKKEKLKAIHVERKQRMAAILTPEQKDKFQEIKKDHKDDKKGEKHHGKGEKFAELSKDLNLSADQSSKIASINTVYKDKFKDVKTNTTISPEQKREQMKEVMQSRKKEIATVLTEDQKKIMKSKMKNYKNKSGVK